VILKTYAKIRLDLLNSNVRIKSKYIKWSLGLILIMIILTG
jgi:hypothetical protein